MLYVCFAASSDNLNSRSQFIRGASRLKAEGSTHRDVGCTFAWMWSVSTQSCVSGGIWFHAFHLKMWLLAGLSSEILWKKWYSGFGRVSQCASCLSIVAEPLRYVGNSDKSIVSKQESQPTTVFVSHYSQCHGRQGAAKKFPHIAWNFKVKFYKHILSPYACSHNINIIIQLAYSIIEF